LQAPQIQSLAIPELMIEIKYVAKVEDHLVACERCLSIYSISSKDGNTKGSNMY
jgi:hypothetical protein